MQEEEDVYDSWEGDVEVGLGDMGKHGVRRNQSGRVSDSIVSDLQCVMRGCDGCDVSDRREGGDCGRCEA